MTIEEIRRGLEEELREIYLSTGLDSLPISETSPLKVELSADLHLPGVPASSKSIHVGHGRGLHPGLEYAAEWDPSTGLAKAGVESWTPKYLDHARDHHMTEPSLMRMLATDLGHLSRIHERMEEMGYKPRIKLETAHGHFRSISLKAGVKDRKGILDLFRAYAEEKR